jgi:hypothetical protein
MTTMKIQTTGAPALLLRLEGLILLIGAVLLYIQQQGNGWLFIVLLFAPDLSAFGYLKNPQFGSLTYNTVHAYLLPALLLLIATIGGSVLGIQIALIWFAHIGLDRTLGYGLKYASAFKDTHLGSL